MGRSRDLSVLRVPNFFELFPKRDGIHSGNGKGLLIKSQPLSGVAGGRPDIASLESHDVYVNCLLLTTR